MVLLHGLGADGNDLIGLAPHFGAVIDRLTRAGKEVVLSAPALITDAREMAELRDLTASDGLLVEANDLSAVSLLAGRRHAIGPFVNIYNEATLAYLTGRGAARICLPVELPATSLAILAANAAGEVELEVQVFGRLPLAVSARCYHARSRGLAKDNCRFACAEDPDGMAVETLDGEPFLAVNGTQTLSHAYGNLWDQLPALAEMGIGRFRLSPQDIDMVAVARLFRDRLDGRVAATAGGQLAGLANGAPFANGFYHGIEGVTLVR